LEAANNTEFDALAVKLDAASRTLFDALAV
jgi:hypothetical protein